MEILALKVLFIPSGCNLKQINTNQNNYDSKFINSESNWIEYLYVVEVKQGVLFQVYASKIQRTAFLLGLPPNSLILNSLTEQKLCAFDKINMQYHFYKQLLTIK